MRNIILALECLLILFAPAAAAVAPWVVERDSTVLIKVYRDGGLAWLGHNHVLEPQALRGRLLIEPSLAAELAFDLADIQLDRPATRARLGDAFSSTLTADAIAATRDNMLGAEGLDATAFPTVRLRVSGPAPQIAEQTYQIDVTLRGVTRSYPVVVTLSRHQNRWRAHGRFSVRQTDFAIEPFSLFAGALSVRDQVEIEFSLFAAPECEVDCGRVIN